MPLGPSFRRAAPGLAAVAVLLAASAARAAWPLLPDAGTAAFADPANWPLDPGFAGEWPLWGFTPDSLAPSLSGPERPLGIGAAVDRAWAVTRGDPRVVLALVGPGITWDEPDLAGRWALSRGELPAPEDAAGQPAPGADPWDRDGDGRFSVRDFTSAGPAQVPTVATIVDPRLTSRADRGDVNGNGFLDPQDLIAVFSNGFDDDGNGFVDDICGWDFVWDDADPFDDLRTFGTLTPSGTLDALAAVAQANNALGGAGACPECSALPLRVAAGPVAEPGRLAAAIRYAVARKTAAAAVSTQAQGAGPRLQAALDEAWKHGLAVLAAPADATGFQHDAPANLERVFDVRPQGFDGTTWQTSTTFWVADRCGASGGHTDATAPSDRCGAGAAALAAGIAGLAQSVGLDHGLTPALSAGELQQLLSREIEPTDGGWTPDFGRGRLDARRVVDAVALGRIPASVDIEAPRWFDVLPSAAPFQVVANVQSRAPCTVTLSAAGGLEPAEDKFVTFAETSAADGVSGPLGTVVPSSLELPPPRPVEDAHAFAVTVRVAVVTHYGDARGEARSEARKMVFLRTEADALTGFPRRVAGVGTASPRLIDLDNDGSDELVVATTDGEIHALDARGDELPGFPMRLPETRHPREAGPQAVSASLAFEDLDGDGRLDVLAVTREGLLAVYDTAGHPLPGFPVELGTGTPPCFVQTPTGCGASGLLDAGTAGLALRDVEPGAVAAPVVAPTLTGLLILQAGLDGFLYGFEADGRPAAGFPFEVSDTRPGRTRIVATPAAADLNEDGWPEIVVVTSEVTDEGRGARAYLLVGGPDGPATAFGWPVRLDGDAAASTGARGGVASPLIADFDGDGRFEIALQAAGGPLRLYTTTGQLALELEGATGAGPATSPAAADLDGDGRLELVSTDVGSDGSTRLMAWHAGARIKENRSGFEAPAPLADGFPFELPGAQPEAGFAIGDLDGDSQPEILAGAGYLLYAVDGAGAQPTGWPKFTGGTLASSPAVGLVKGQMVAATATREGGLFAWNGYGFPSNISWDGFHHDPQNSGFTGTPLPRRNLASIGVPNPKLRPAGCCSGAPGPAELWGGLLLAGAALRRRSRLRVGAATGWRLPDRACTRPSK